MEHSAVRKASRRHRRRRRPKPFAEWSLAEIRKDLKVTRMLMLLANGASPRETAGAMGIPQHAVDNSLRRLRRRFEVRTTTQLVAVAIALGVIPPPTISMDTPASLAQRPTDGNHQAR